MTLIPLPFPPWPLHRPPAWAGSDSHSAGIYARRLGPLVGGLGSFGLGVVMPCNGGQGRRGRGEGGASGWVRGRSVLVVDRWIVGHRSDVNGPQGRRWTHAKAQASSPAVAYLMMMMMMRWEVASGTMRSLTISHSSLII